MVAVGGYCGAGGAGGACANAAAPTISAPPVPSTLRTSDAARVMLFSPSPYCCANGRPLGFPRQLAVAAAPPNRQPAAAQFLCSPVCGNPRRGGWGQHRACSGIIDLTQEVGLTSPEKFSGG